MKKLSIFTILFISKMSSVFADITTELLPNRIGEGNNIAKLPHWDIATFFIPRFIKIITVSSYTLSVIFLIYAGVLYITAQEDEERTSQAKHIFIYSVVGFLVMTLAYVFVEGVISFNFF